MALEDEMEDTIPKKLAIVSANLIAQGLFTQTAVGLEITAKGKIVARKMWLALPDEEKLLYAWLTRRLYDMRKL